MLAKCNWCGQEMVEGGECTGNDTVRFTMNEWGEPGPEPEDLPSIPYDGPGEICHDCSVRRGAKHHPGCDMEICPRCKGQLIGCGCLDEDEVVR